MTMLTRFLIALGAATLALSSGATAATASERPATTKVVLFGENVGLARVDANGSGPDHADLVYRELRLSRTQGGPTIGVSYAQAEIIAFDADKQIDVRRVDQQSVLPGGELYAVGVTNLALGTVATPGFRETYAIIGGTGKYLGARGSVSTTLLPDGKTFKSVITLLR